MNLKKRMVPKNFVIYLITIMLLISTQGCKKNDTRIDLIPFIEMARSAICASIRNRIFIIDNELVLSDRYGSCPDYIFHIILYGSTIDTVLCEYHDSYGGWVKKIYNEKYHAIFDTIINNLDKSDLGLGSSHTVSEINF